MDEVTRRAMLAATAAGGVFTLAASAAAQTNEAIPQPQRPGRGGTDPGPRNVVRDRQNPDLLNPPSTDHGTLPNLRFSFADAHVRQETLARLLDTTPFAPVCLVTRSHRFSDHGDRADFGARKRMIIGD
jgi:hypothetical protein